MEMVNTLAHSAFEPHGPVSLTEPLEEKQWFWWAAHRCFEATGQLRLWNAFVSQSPGTAQTIAECIDCIAKSRESSERHSLVYLCKVAESVSYLASFGILATDIPDHTHWH